MTTFEKSAFVTKWIPVKNLSVVWSSAQRPLDESWAKQIADNFDPDLFDELVVTLPNGNGIFHIVDGQHRKRGVQIKYGEEEQVPCRVVQAADPSRAAEIFDRANSGRKKPRPIDMFRVRVTAGYETEVAVNRIVRAAGYRVSPGLADGNIAAVQALISIYRSFGADVLKDTLRVIQGTWGMDKNAVVAQIVRGIGAFMAEHGHKANWQRLSEKTQKAYTPGRLIGAAKGLREITRASTGEATKQVLVNLYNKGLKTGHLSEKAYAA